MPVESQVKFEKLKGFWRLGVGQTGCVEPFHVVFFFFIFFGYLEEKASMLLNCEAPEMFLWTQFSLRHGDE